MSSIVRRKGREPHERRQSGWCTYFRPRKQPLELPQPPRFRRGARRPDRHPRQRCRLREAPSTTSDRERVRLPLLRSRLTVGFPRESADNRNLTRLTSRNRDRCTARLMRGRGLRRRAGPGRLWVGSCCQLCDPARSSGLRSCRSAHLIPSTEGHMGERRGKPSRGRPRESARPGPPDPVTCPGCTPFGLSLTIIRTGRSPEAPSERCLGTSRSCPRWGLNPRPKDYESSALTG